MNLQHVIIKNHYGSTKKIKSIDTRKMLSSKKFFMIVVTLILNVAWNIFKPP